MSSNPNANPNFDEHRWIINILRTLEEPETDTDFPVCIFSVPKILMSSDPDSYIPKEVAIGPQHYWRPELYEMERYKLASAKRAQSHFNGDHKFQDVVDQLKELELQIRACYHNFLNFSNEALAWVMALGASFLLEFLLIYAIKDAKLSITFSSQSMSHLLDYAGTKAAHNAILRDTVMLENQIPLFVLRKVLEFEYLSLESVEEILKAMLMGFCEEVSPFILMKDMTMFNVSECAHLLGYLYDTVVPKSEQKASEIIDVVDDEVEAMQPQERYSADPAYSSKLFRPIWKLVPKLNIRPIRLIKNLLPLISILARQFQYILFREGNKSGDDESSSHPNEKDMSKPPLVEEITIPSVTELHKSNVTFSATVGNISTVSFDTETATLHLPTISLDVNSNLVLRNLVAYEASYASGPLIFTRYTEFMNGIIDTGKDAKLLREKGIILNRLKNDAEVAHLWNGMSRSIRLTKVPHIDKVIEDVNKYYNSQWKVKFRKYMKYYVFGSWQVFTLIAIIMLLLLMILQGFCSVYTCRKFDLNSSQTRTDLV